VIAEIEGNKLEIDFEQAGCKRVLDSFVSVGRFPRSVIASEAKQSMRRRQGD